MSFGWGTNLTNDFRGLRPGPERRPCNAISLVCKVSEANGRPAVKLSDNPQQGDRRSGRRSRATCACSARSGASEHPILV